MFPHEKFLHMLVVLMTNMRCAEIIWIWEDFKVEKIHKLICMRSEHEKIDFVQYLFYFPPLFSVHCPGRSSHTFAHSLCYHAQKLILKLVDVSENFLFLHLLADSQWMVLCTGNFESANFGRGLYCKYTLPAEIRIWDLQVQPATNP